MTDENTPAIPDMTDAECATAYRDLRKRANDAGFATVGEWIDAQPDTDGLARTVPEDVTAHMQAALRYADKSGDEYIFDVVEHLNSAIMCLALAEGAGK